MKVIAFYLPQFHEIEENNNWWGKGFTEWTNVKNAKPLFNSHNQPRIPANNNYYDLSDIRTLKWQQKLASEYNIEGFCFYHYWFKDGKKLLEKPAELLLENTDIDLKFCFSWANEPWTRSWDGKYGEIIMPQDYGNKKEWVEHFNYLLPFFKDKRYITIDGKPVFVIYKSSSIPDMDEMMELWNKLAIESGIPEIYFINTLRSRETTNVSDGFSACVEFEPAYTSSNLSNLELNKRRIHRLAKISLNKIFKMSKTINLPISYDTITKLSVQKKPLKYIKTIPGAFVEWDNTPRKGINGSFYKGFSSEKFKNYFNKKVIKGIEEYKSDFIFINAWNEWAEGTYLEPDEKKGFSILEAVREVILQNK